LKAPASGLPSPPLKDRRAEDLHDLGTIAYPYRDSRELSLPDQRSERSWGALKQHHLLAERREADDACHHPPPAHARYQRGDYRHRRRQQTGNGRALAVEDAIRRVARDGFAVWPQVTHVHRYMQGEIKHGVQQA